VLLLALLSYALSRRVLHSCDAIRWVPVAEAKGWVLGRGVRRPPRDRFRL